MKSRSETHEYGNPAIRGPELSWRLACLLRAALVPALVLTLQSMASAQEAAQFFRQNCMSCHTIGSGRLTGPDLKDVLQRRDRVWLGRFLLDPKGMIASGDPYAAQLQQEARGVVMPTVSGMSKERADALLDLIEAESKLEKSQFIGLQIPDGPFSEADIALGRDIFLGRARLKNGGPSCVGCHTAIGLPGLGGGRLGPDLSKVFERLESRKTLGSWLLAPPTTTMQPVWRGHPLEAEEILPLVAYFEDVSRRGGEDTSPGRMNFFLIGLAGAVAALVGFDLAWRKRFRAVRRPMVRAAGLKRGQLR